MAPRYVLLRHTDHPVYSWCVLDTELQITHGYGMAEADAAWLLEQLDGR